MYTLQFSADGNDTAGSFIDLCTSRYCNVRLSNIIPITPGNLIQKISNGDATQFIVTLGYQYTTRFSIGMDPLARTASFLDLKATGAVSDDAIYISGPRPVCPDDLAWILYSVVEKQPATLVNNSDVWPPYANQSGLAIISLDPRPTFDGEQRYLQLYFPENIDNNFQITFESSVGNIVFATRVNGIRWEWTYREPGGQPTTVTDNSIILNSQITFIAI